jgi:hypothetical protein
MLPFRVAACAFGLCLIASGCSVSPIAKHVTAVSTIATQVITNSEDAYRAAIDLHDREQVSAGVLLIQEGKPWDYDQITPLLSPEALKTRVDILDALKTYTQSLAEDTGGLASPALTTAATATGTNLKTIGTTITSEPGLKSSGFSIPAETANLVSAATLAIGEYLVSKRVNAALPAITAQMDPQVEQLCKLLDDDIVILRRSSKKDYEDLSRQEWTFIQSNKDKLTPVELRDEVEKLPTYRKDEQSADALLAGLHKSLAQLALTHHALAAAAQGNNPETVTARLGELVAAGNDLKTYYKSLPTK